MKKTTCYLWVIVLIVFCLTLDSPGQAQSYDLARKKMVENQLKARDINDPDVLKAMLEVKRHKFVPEYLRDKAYSDHALPIGHQQTISQPYIVALMTQLAKVNEKDRVLEIGTGSGYQAAVLAKLAKFVYSIEIIEPLAHKAEERLGKLGYTNVQVKHGDGFKGWKEFAPFDAIIVTCAPPDIPPPLLNQLAQGGRMIIPVGERWQKLKVIKKYKAGFKVTEIIPVRFVPMTGPGITNYLDQD